MRIEFGKFTGIRNAYVKTRLPLHSYGSNFGQDVNGIDFFV